MANAHLPVTDTADARPPDNIDHRSRYFLKNCLAGNFIPWLSLITSPLSRHPEPRFISFSQLALALFPARPAVDA